MNFTVFDIMKVALYDIFKVIADYLLLFICHYQFFLQRIIDRSSCYKLTKYKITSDEQIRIADISKFFIKVKGTASANTWDFLSRFLSRIQLGIYFCYDFDYIDIVLFLRL